MDRYARQRRLAEVGDAGQARLLAASHRASAAAGGLTELVYLHRAGLRSVSLDVLTAPAPFDHAGVFRHAASRRHAAGAWRALRTLLGLLERSTA